MMRDAMIFPAGRQTGGILCFSRTARVRPDMEHAGGRNKCEAVDFQGRQHTAQLELEIVIIDGFAAGHECAPP